MARKKNSRRTRRNAKKSLNTDEKFKQELKNLGLSSSSSSTQSKRSRISPRRSPRRSARRSARRSRRSRRTARRSPKRTRKSKGPSPYNLFVKKMSPILRKSNPEMRQPNIMKLIAKEWNSQ